MSKTLLIDGKPLADNEEFLWNSDIAEPDVPASLCKKWMLTTSGRLSALYNAADSEGRAWLRKQYNITEKNEYCCKEMEDLFENNLIWHPGFWGKFFPLIRIHDPYNPDKFKYSQFKMKYCFSCGKKIEATLLEKNNCGAKLGGGE